MERPSKALTLVGVALALLLVAGNATTYRLRSRALAATDDTGRRGLRAPLDPKTVVFKGARANANQGNHGGAWTWCTHVVKYGLNFDLGLASFLAHQLRPTTTLEFGSGLGLYSDYMVRYGGVASAVALEPEDMSAAGVFKPGQMPVQITGNVLENEAVRNSIAPADLVYSIEVAEHIPAALHPTLVDFLAEKTGKYLVFSAARPDQPGTGHIPLSMLPRDQWIEIFEAVGLVYLPRLTEMMLENADDRNINHKVNPIVFGRSIKLDTDVKRFQVTRNHDHSEENLKAIQAELFPHVLNAINEVNCYA